MFKFYSVFFTLLLWFPLLAQEESKLSSKGTAVNYTKERKQVDSLFIPNKLSSRETRSELTSKPASDQKENDFDGVLSKRKKK